MVSLVFLRKDPLSSGQKILSDMEWLYGPTAGAILMLAEPVTSEHKYAFDPGVVSELHIRRFIPNHIRSGAINA